MTITHKVYVYHGHLPDSAIFLFFGLSPKAGGRVNLVLIRFLFGSLYRQKAPTFWSCFLSAFSSGRQGTCLQWWTSLSPRFTVTNSKPTITHKVYVYHGHLPDSAIFLFFGLSPKAGGRENLVLVRFLFGSLNRWKAPTFWSCFLSALSCGRQGTCLQWRTSLSPWFTVTNSKPWLRSFSWLQSHGLLSYRYTPLMRMIKTIPLGLVPVINFSTTG